ncbi:AAA family ATPase [Halorubrum halodurans]|uniref:AAA+ ATPase domain-containing protein n=1 Tax=Halorubrum halodurans TaxID=1383851 RepID=A0A256IJC5_9EURY|nr:ATP-binding protein [Halorubrum halodurans]OYR56649.1 hypothetical protein DJ70_08005 [Halorubrum halodurans]
MSKPNQPGTPDQSRTPATSPGPRRSLTQAATHTVLFTITVLVVTATTLTVTTIIHRHGVPGLIIRTAAVIIGTVTAISITRRLLTNPGTTGDRSETNRVIGIAGFTGTGTAAITAVTIPNTAPIVTGTEPLTAIIAAALLSGITSYEYYRPRLKHAALAHTPDTTGEHDYDPEFVRDKTVQWNTDTSTSRDRNEHRTPRNQPGDTTPDDDATGTPTDEEGGEGINTTDYEYRWDTGDGPGFGAVGGMNAVKTELQRDVITPLTTRREKAEELGITAPNIIFYGPPGTGKSFLAEALAEELELPFAKLSGADIQSKWINESASKVKTLFREAERVAEQAGGAVVFLDELDSVLKTRDGAGSTHEEDNKVVNEFLNHLEGTGEHNIVFIGATNRLDALDDAGIRSGRIDKKIEIGEPDAEARAAVLDAQLDGLPHDLTRRDINSLARDMDGYVPADIERVVQDAAKRILHEDRDVITRGDVDAVIAQDTA